MASVPACDICGEPVRPADRPTDRQGGLHEIVYPGYRQVMVLCWEHAKPLEQYRNVGKRVLSGALPAEEALAYLPTESDV